MNTDNVKTIAMSKPKIIVSARFSNSNGLSRPNQNDTISDDAMLRTTANANKKI